MRASPLITIGIPCFNAAPWLREAIQSALDQDCFPKEVIVVDDGSTDGSRPIIESFGSSIRVFFEPHRGGNPTRNVILREARGEWVQFLDADDYLLPSKISIQMAEAGELDSWDVLVSPVWREDYTRDRERRVRPAPEEREFDPLSRILFLRVPQAGGFLWRKSALESIGKWDEQRAVLQDTELFARAIRHELRMKWTGTPGAVYRYGWSKRTVSKLNPERNEAGILRLALEMAAWLQARGNWTEEIRLKSAGYFFCILRHLAGRNLRTAVQIHEEARRLHLWAPGEVGGRHWAPAHYAFIYRLMGFAVAEWVAQLRRKPDAEYPVVR